ncbi:hypothetical protein GCM10022215_31750 [Nocardioides fonticola]|uniref:Uncharacterized protein n=1 Tax=Nocardioides fonticola TaxID=450363 RepID=A0ABP7XR02_9ACTN
MQTLSVGVPESCAACGGPLPPPAQLCRTRIWCSDRCRRDAYTRRQSPAQSAAEVRVVERVVVQEHGLAECAHRVALSPVACMNVLRELRRLAEAGTLQSSPKWQRPRLAVEALVDVLHPTSRGRRW